MSKIILIPGIDFPIESNNDTSAFEENQSTSTIPQGINLLSVCSQPDKQPHKATSWEQRLKELDVIKVTSLSDWQLAMEEVREIGICALDMETSGLDPLSNRICLIQVAVPVYPTETKQLVNRLGLGPEQDGKVKVFVAHLAAFDKDVQDKMLLALAEVLADGNVLKVLHNAKFDLSMLRSALGGQRIPLERLFDTMIASQLINAGDFIPYDQFPSWCAHNGIRQTKKGNRTVYLDQHGHAVEFEKVMEKMYPKHSLLQLAHRHLEVWLDKEQQTANWAGEITEEMMRYAAEDAAVLLILYEIQSKLLRANNLVETAKLEFNCLPAVIEIELSGMPFDAPRAREMLKDLEAVKNDEEAKLLKIAAEADFKPRPRKNTGTKVSQAFNANSQMDVLRCLALLLQKEKLLADSGNLVLDGEELSLSTNDNMLLHIKNRLPKSSAMVKFIDALRNYRSVGKQMAFLEQWLKKLHPSDDRLHPSLRQLNPQGVGRFSAYDPNIQQAPRGSAFRSLFKAQAGRKIIIADYSGVEMRIMAQLSKDFFLLSAFKDDVDIHRFTASSINGKPIDEVTKDERQAAKAFNFGLIYGMQAYTLKGYAEASYGVSMTLNEAELAREKFFNLYPRIGYYHKRQQAKAFEWGFEEFGRHDAKRGYYLERRPCARTLGGRLRVWPTEERKKRSGNGTYSRKVGSFTEMYNTPDQGTGADILKCSMSRLYRELIRREWDDVKIINCVHDELVLEAPEDKVEEAADVLGSVMEYTASRYLPDVPVEVEVGVGDSWAEK